MPNLSCPALSAPPVRRAASLVASCAFALAGFAAPSAGHAQVSPSNAVGTMIAAPGAQKQVSFAIGPRTDLPGSTLTVRVYPFDDVGKPLHDPVVTLHRKLAGKGTGETANVAVNVPRAGLYRVEAEVTTGNGAPVADAARGATTLAFVVPRTTVGASDWGVVTHFGQGGQPPSVVLPLVKQAGFSWIRDELYWQEIEKKPNVFTFPARYDDYIAQTAKFGISPLVVLDYGNPSAYPQLFASSQFPDNDATRELFVHYVQAVVKRYGNTVKTWEVWNEPNFGQIGYDNYLALLKDTYAAIKKLSPDSTVISCGGGGTGGGPGADCLWALMQRGGLDAQDGFSVHPYMPPNPPETGYKGKGGPIESVSIPSTWPYLKQLVAAHPRSDGKQLQVWITELGWPVNPQVPGQDEATQAANLARSYLLSRRYNAVRVLFWYDFIDDGNDLRNFEFNFGLLHHDLTPKPAFVASSVLGTTLGNRAFSKALVDDADVKAWQYGSGNDTMIAGWTVGPDERTATLNLPAGRYVMRDWQGAETPVTVTNQPYSWRVGPLPRYLVPVQTAQ